MYLRSSRHRFVSEALLAAREGINVVVAAVGDSQTLSIPELITIANFNNFFLTNTFDTMLRVTAVRVLARYA